MNPTDPGPGVARAKPVTTRAVRLTPAGLRAVRSGHPWVYDQSIRSVKGDYQPGDLGIVFDDRNRLAAVGLLDPGSPITLRVLATEATRFDADWLAATIDTARARRRPLEADNTGMRLVNGEGDGLPGLIVDRYDDTVVIKCYTEAWFPYLDWIRTFLESDYQAGVLRLAGRLGPAAGRAGLEPGPWWGEVGDGRVAFTENGLVLWADVLAGHKTGHFFDQRHHRRRAARTASGAMVLDVFSCTGGFGLHAAAAGAAAVTLTDLSGPALATARSNFAANGLSSPTTIEGDAFDVLEAQPAGRYDLVIVDPPAFATRAEHHGRAISAYRRLARSAWATVRPGGRLVQASCSTRVSADEFRTALTDTLPDAVVDWESGHDIDHPVRHPEGAYLKALALIKP